MSAKIVDVSFSEALAEARLSILEQQLTGVYFKSIVRKETDFPPNGPLFTSGERAALGRGVAGVRRIDAQDRILVEHPATYRRYNATTEWTILFGTVADAQARRSGHAEVELARDAGETRDT